MKMYLKEIGCEDTDWIHVAQDRVQWGGGSCEHDNETSVCMKGGNILTS
jgi:hypothetical protein